MPTVQITVGGSSGGGGTGNVVGPASSTDNAIAVWDGATGQLLKDSSATLISGVITATAYKASGTVAAAGVIRLANATGISWKNQAGSGDVSLVSQSSPADTLSFSGNGIYCPTTNAQLGIGTNNVFGFGMYLRNDNGSFIQLDNGTDCGMAIDRAAANQIRLKTGNASRWMSFADGDGTVDTVKIQGGVVTLGRSGGTPTHVLNTATGTPASDVLTLTNGPTGKAGNPAVYLTLNINGTARQIPAW